MTRLLAIDTTTEACSAALWNDGSLSGDRFVVEPRGHTQRLLPMIESLLEAADWSLNTLDGLVCTRGPGSFTGVRVGISAAQGLAFAANLPVMGVSTLDVLAWQAHTADPHWSEWQVAMDARMNEVYYAAYQCRGGTLVRSEAEQLLAPQAVSVKPGNQVGRIGSGWSLPPLDLAGEVSSTDSLPRASTVAGWGHHLLARGAQWQLPETLQPVYLRDQVTHQAAR